MPGRWSSQSELRRLLCPTPGAVVTHIRLHPAEEMAMCGLDEGLAVSDLLCYFIPLTA